MQCLFMSWQQKASLQDLLTCGIMMIPIIPWFIGFKSSVFIQVWHSRRFQYPPICYICRDSVPGSCGWHFASASHLLEALATCVMFLLNLAASSIYYQRISINVFMVTFLC